MTAGATYDAIGRTYGHLRRQAELDVGLRLVTAEVRRGPGEAA